jgi:hypothetical protein
MRFNLINRAARRRAVVDGALAAYTAWREQCSAVQHAYRQWASASKADEPDAFEAYRAALDREEGAAKRYARLIPRAGHHVEFGLARQLAQIETGSGA